MSVNTVVVGYGNAGKKFHAYLVSLVDRLNIYGVVSGRDEGREQAQADHGCKTFERIEDALGDTNVDLVILATPNHTHADLAIQALDAGKNVVTDKPMCLTLLDCDRMIAAARSNGKLLTVFQNRRFDGDYLTVRKLIDDGTLGDVRWAEMAWQGFRPMGGWRGQADQGGGRYYDLGAHLVDQMSMIFPAGVRSVYCRMHHDYDNTDTESEALLVIHFQDGKTGVCDFSSMAALSKPRFYVRGTGGTFRKYGIDPQEPAMKAGDIDSAREDPETYGTFTDAEGSRTIETIPGRWRNYYENIADVLLDGAEPVVKHHELRRQIGILDAGVQSAASDSVEPVDLPGLEE
jgi:scyllo-inositol 2-dehydrogenase (NADP+)